MASAFAVSVAACASSGSRSAACTSDLLASTRSINDVLDSAAAQQMIEESWPAEAGLTLARLGGGTDPDSEPVTIWSESLEDHQRDELKRLLAEASTVPLATSGASYIFLGDEAGPALRRVDRLAMCPPRILGRNRLARRIQEESRGLGITGPVVVRLYVFVEPSGFSGEVRIDETSGDVRIDEAAARVFDGVDFTPAQVEGIPVPVWASFPVTFTPR